MQLLQALSKSSGAGLDCCSKAESMLCTATRAASTYKKQNQVPCQQPAYKAKQQKPLWKAWAN